MFLTGMSLSSNFFQGLFPIRARAFTSMVQSDMSNSLAKDISARGERSGESFREQLTVAVSSPRPPISNGAMVNVPKFFPDLYRVPSMPDTEMSFAGLSTETDAMASAKSSPLIDNDLILKDSMRIFLMSFKLVQPVQHIIIQTAARTAILQVILFPISLQR